ncbi:MAG: hypothetical protein KF696_01255 [Planctomycetes bacterium]|nr:hypothetical protein [Planctomycetota bacterium]MCW8134433.1 hypothetical protein [Planctomycetota bacterium]
MYAELWSYTKEAWQRSPFLKDGEFWTGVACGAGAYTAFSIQPELLSSAQDQLPNILTIVSILFGFVVSALVYYIQAAKEWSAKENVRKVAQKLIDWQVWTILTLLLALFLSLFLAVWQPVPKPFDGDVAWYVAIVFAALAWLLSYGLFQIVNHTLIAWWVFKNVKRLTDEPKFDPYKPPSADSAKDDKSQGRE